MNKPNNIIIILAGKYESSLPALWLWQAGMTFKAKMPDFEIHNIQISKNL